MRTAAHPDDHLVKDSESAKWIEQQPVEHQYGLANAAYDALLSEASQPKTIAGQACIRLCSLIDQSTRSQSQHLKTWAFSSETTLRLFQFYLEWNESDNARSMKLVLDSLTQLLARNPDVNVAATTKEAVLNTLVPIVIGKSTKPAAKSSLKLLEHFLGKDIFNLGDLKRVFVQYRPDAATLTGLAVWKVFLADLSQWMHTHFVRPQAGRFMSCLYRTMARDDDGRHVKDVAFAWQQWLVGFLVEDSNLLEPIRNYVFLPLFKNHRPEAMKFLENITEQEAISTATDIRLDPTTLLQLAALETGKKVGLIEEPALDNDKKSDSDDQTSLMLRDSVFESVLAHPSHEVRSVAFTLLITCPSTTKPYSYAALNLLRKHLATYFADPDPKFRVDIAGKVRDMFKRVRGAICVLKRSIPRARAKARKEAAAEAASSRDASAPQTILYHANLITLPESQLAQVLDYHVDFLRWYLRFLCTELIPTASYQRHAASLRALQYILRVEGDAAKTWETDDDQSLFFDLFDSKWARVLLDLTLDPFDDVRDLSAKAVSKLLSDQRYRNFRLASLGRDGEGTSILSPHMQRASERAKRTARVDHSDGAARIFQAEYILAPDETTRTALLSTLVDELERRIALAQADLGQAVLEAPLHGTFASVCYTWQVVAEQRLSKSEKDAASVVQERLVTCCESVWNVVQEVLCDDSPEGHLPNDLDDVQGLDTKDLLSYCFRAVDESSNLMRMMILALKYHGKETSLYPTPSLFDRIGNLTFQQLATLRHRGAFTTVSMTFAACCQRTKFMPTDGPSYLNVWYEGSLEAIYGQRSTTRRSAGIPSMITGILSAGADQPGFEEVVEKLMEIASVPAEVTETDGSQLPQVHAFNCLKEIYKNSLLSSAANKSEKYLPSCLELAANGLRSEVWAIRNCGLIFLRSLIDSLFGNQESKAMIEAGWDGKANRVAFHRYPSLPTVLVNLLKSGHQIMTPTSSKSSAAAEAVFPALDIIRRAGPPDLLRDELQDLISVYLASPVWHVREIAARTLCSCLLHDKWLDGMRKLIDASTKGNAVALQNKCHGTLLSLKFVVERLAEVAPEQLKEKLPSLVELLQDVQIESRFAFSSEVLAAYMEAISLIWTYQRTQGQPFSTFNLPSQLTLGGALQRRQQAVCSTYLAFQSPEPIQVLSRLLLDARRAEDDKTAVLETMRGLWKLEATDQYTLVALCDLYLAVGIASASKSVKSQALCSLAAALDQIHVLLQDEPACLDFLQLQETLPQLWRTLPLQSLNPMLGNAIVRLSGCVVEALAGEPGSGPETVARWGLMMADAGEDANEFDTRHAAAESLQSYFASQTDHASTQNLNAIMALYDVLNDDDDEIRNVGSLAASHILGQLLVPLESASRLLHWLAANYADNERFHLIVLNRMVGGTKPEKNWASAAAQIASAVELNDSLFAVEEQNLFVDEVREAERWSLIYSALHWTPGHEDHAHLVTWLRVGLEEMAKLFGQEDGPLGWASRPDAFALCSRILMGARAASANDEELRGALEELGNVRNSHARNEVSPLLSAMAGWTSGP